MLRKEEKDKRIRFLKNCARNAEEDSDKLSRVPKICLFKRCVYKLTSWANLDQTLNNVCHLTREKLQTMLRIVISFRKIGNPKLNFPKKTKQSFENFRKEKYCQKMENYEKTRSFL